MVSATMSQAAKRPQPFAHDDAPDDEALFLHYRASGCQDTFAELVRRNERALYNFLRRYLGDAELAEDVFQRTFLQVHLKRDSFQQGRSLRPWIYRIATNQAIDALRRSRRHRALSLNYAADDAMRNGTMMDALADPAPQPTAAMDRREESAWSRRTVGALPERLRLVVELVFFQGLSYREAAESLAIPIGTVKSRMNVALDKLRQAWQDRGPTVKQVAAAG